MHLSRPVCRMCLAYKLTTTPCSKADRCVQNMYAQMHANVLPSCSQTSRRNSPTMIVLQRPPQAPAAAKLTSSVMKRTAALVSHWCRCLTHQKTPRQERLERLLYLLRMVRQHSIRKKLMLSGFLFRSVVSDQSHFIISDEWLALGRSSLKDIFLLLFSLNLRRVEHSPS